MAGGGGLQAGCSGAELAELADALSALASSPSSELAAAFLQAAWPKLAELAPPSACAIFSALAAWGAPFTAPSLAASTAFIQEPRVRGWGQGGWASTLL